MVTNPSISSYQKGLVAFATTITLLALAVTAVAIASIFVPAAFSALFAGTAIYLGLGLGATTVIFAITAVAVSLINKKMCTTAIESTNNSDSDTGCTQKTIRQTFQEKLGDPTRYTEILVGLWSLDASGKVIKAESDFMDTLDSALTQAFQKMGSNNLSDPYGWHVFAQYEDGSIQSLYATCASTLNKGEEVLSVKKEILLGSSANRLNEVQDTLDRFLKGQVLKGI